jgi:hypothetical protein
MFCQKVSLKGKQGKTATLAENFFFQITVIHIPLKKSNLAKKNRYSNFFYCFRKSSENKKE